MRHFMLKPGLTAPFGRTCATRRIVFRPSIPVQVDEDEAAILTHDVGHALVEVTLEEIPGIEAVRPRPLKPPVDATEQQPKNQSKRAKRTKQTSPTET